jgi:hypothetical protein
MKEQTNHPSSNCFQGWDPGEPLFQNREDLCITEMPTCRMEPCRFQKSHWQKIRTMVNLPVMSPFKKRYAWVQLAGHTGEHHDGWEWGSGSGRGQQHYMEGR